MNKNIMHTKTGRSRLVSAIADLNEDLAVKLVKEFLETKTDPSLLADECQEGLRLVGERYERQIYYLSGLVMAGEIFREITDIIISSTPCRESGKKSGKILLGTVAGDIHDLGKNMVKSLLTSHNFSVIDLGVDIAPEEFLKQTKETGPDIIGLSGLITHAYDSMRQTVSLLRQEGCRQPVIIGGSLLNDEVLKYTGANFWVNNASSGLKICQNIRFS